MASQNPKKRKQIKLTQGQLESIENSPLNASKFLQVLFLQELGALVDSFSSAYLKFLLIIQGIEFLGACEDDYPFELYQKELPKKRFNKGLRNFRKDYHPFTGEASSIKFFEDLRSPMVHQFRPNQSKIRLSDRTSSYFQGELHLSYDHRGRLILVLEDFYQDFADAVKSVMQKIESGQLNASKLTDPHITIESIQDFFQSS